MYGLFFHLFFYFIVYYGGCSCCYSHHNNNNLRQRIIFNCQKPDAGREHFFFQPLQRNVIGNFETLFYLYNDSRSIKFCLILRKSVFQLKFQEYCFDLISQSGPLVSYCTSTVSYRTVATSAVLIKQLLRQRCHIAPLLPLPYHIFCLPCQFEEFSELRKPWNARKTCFRFSKFCCCTSCESCE